MKFALIIPTRGDRPQFIKQCKFLISRQTLQPNEVIWMDYPPEDNRKDITQRYRRGVEQATKKGYNFVVFWEDDDWYHPKYLEWLVGEWQKKGMPNAFGVGETYYYHHSLGGLLHYHHPERSSAFCMIMKLPVRMKWPHDYQPFLDMHIYKTIGTQTIMFPKNQIYAIGIKHGIGLSGGGGHRAIHGYKILPKENREWFYRNVGEDIKFYDTLKNQMSTPNVKPKIINNTPTVNHVQRGKITRVNSNPQLRRRRK